MKFIWNISKCNIKFVPFFLHLEINSSRYPSNVEIDSRKWITETRVSNLGNWLEAISAVRYQWIQRGCRNTPTKMRHKVNCVGQHFHRRLFPLKSDTVERFEISQNQLPRKEHFPSVCNSTRKLINSSRPTGVVFDGKHLSPHPSTSLRATHV